MPFTGEDADVGAPEGGVAQGVAHRIDGAVDVTQVVRKLEHLVPARRRRRRRVLLVARRQRLQRKSTKTGYFLDVWHRCGASSIQAEILSLAPP